MNDVTRCNHRVLNSAIVAIGVAVIVILLTGCGGRISSESEGPEQPTFDFVIPAGSGDRIDDGQPLEILPAELVAELDETIQIVNEDDRAHQVGPWFVGPGETLRQRFNVAGVFTGSCSVHPSGGFTVTVSPARGQRS